MYDVPPVEFYLVLADVSRHDANAAPAVEQFKQIVHARRDLSRGCSSFELFSFNFCRRVLSLYADDPFFFNRACRGTKANRRSFFRWLQDNRLYIPIHYEQV